MPEETTPEATLPETATPETTTPVESATGTAVAHELSYGEKAVGLSFNPSGDPGVADIKKHYADIIDKLNVMRDEFVDGEAKRLFSIAITEAQSAQMWAVKAITYKF